MKKLIVLSTIALCGGVFAEIETWSGTLSQDAANPTKVFTAVSSLADLKGRVESGALMLGGKMGGNSIMGQRAFSAVLLDETATTETELVYQFQLNDYNHEAPGFTGADKHLKVSWIKFTAGEDGLYAVQTQKGYFNNKGPEYVGTYHPTTDAGWGVMTGNNYQVVELHVSDAVVAKAVPSWVTTGVAQNYGTLADAMSAADEAEIIASVPDTEIQLTRVDNAIAYNGVAAISLATVFKSGLGGNDKKGLHKKGTGTVVLTHAEALGDTKGLDIDAGEVKAGVANAFGDKTVTVNAGATLNLNGYASNANGYTVIGNGGEIKSERSHIYGGANCIGSLTLNADTRVYGGWRFGLTKASGTTSLALNGHTLDVAIGTVNDSFNFRNTTVTGEGTIAVAANTFVLVYDDGMGSTVATNATWTMTASSKLELNMGGTLTVGNFEAADGATIICGNAKQGTLKVLGTYKNPNSLPKLELADGATIDVATVPESGVVASAATSLTVNGVSTLNLAVAGQVSEEYDLAQVDNTVVATPKTEDSDAVIDGVKYESITNAVLSLSGGKTLTLLRDVTLDETLVIDGLVNGTIDLNGHSIVNTGDGDVVSIAYGATVTITGEGSIVKDGADFAITSRGLTTISAANGTPVIGGIVAAPSPGSKVSFAYGYYPETPVKTKIDWTGCVSNADTPVVSVHDMDEHPYSSVYDLSLNPIQEIDGVLYEAEFGGGFTSETEYVRFFTYLYTVAEVTVDASHVTIPYLFNVATDTETQKRYARIAKAVKSGMLNGKPLFSYTPMPADINFRVVPDSGYQNPKVTANGSTIEPAESGYYHITAVEGGVAIVVTAEEIPTVPTWIDASDAAAVAKYMAWASAKGVADPTAAKQKAFAFNCANTDDAIGAEEAAFAITSIEIINGVPQVTAKLVNLAGEDYNVTPVVRGSATVDGAYTLDMTDPTARFFRAFIDL